MTQVEVVAFRPTLTRRTALGRLARGGLPVAALLALPQAGPTAVAAAGDAPALLPRLRTLQEGWRALRQTPARARAGALVADAMLETLPVGHLVAWLRATDRVLPERAGAA